MLNTVIETLPQFVSPYFSAIFCRFFDSRLYENGDSFEELHTTITDLSKTISQKISPRVLLTPLIGHHAKFATFGIEALCSYYDLVGSVVQQMNREAIISFYKLLFTFFLTAFSARSTLGDEYDKKVLIC